MNETAIATRSTLTGWRPQVGALVWQQMYGPQDPKPDSTIEERVERGHLYGSRFLTRVFGITDDYDGRGLTRFYTKDDGCGPGMFPNKGHGPSWTESDWCVLEDASAVEGALF